MILFYQRGPVATSEEKERARSLGRVRFRNGARWRGETEPCDAVWTRREDIAAAYRTAGAKVLEEDIRVVQKPGGWWYIYRGDEEIASGRGSESLKHAKDELVGSEDHAGDG